MKGRTLFNLLWRLQFRRFVNQMAGWRLRQMPVLSLAILILILALIGTHLVMGSYLQRLMDPEQLRATIPNLRFTAYEDVADQGARLMIIFLSSTLLSALFLKWGHWQSLERDADWDWLAAQPVSPLALFVARCLVESLWPQGLALFILPFFTMLGLGRGLPLPTAFGLGLILLILLQALLAAPRLSFDLWLRSHWRAKEVRTVRGLFGLGGSGLLVFSMQSLHADPSWALAALDLGWFWDKTPTALAVRIGLFQDIAALISLGLLVLIVHCTCYLWASIVLQAPRLAGTSVGWQPAPRRVRGLLRQLWHQLPALTARRVQGLLLRLWHQLHPLTRRDIWMLIRDRHFFLQIIIGPLVFAIVPLEMLGDMSGQRSAAVLLTMAFSAGLIFLMGAVFPLLQIEGRSLWMLFTWPESLTRFVQRRLQVFCILAAAYATLVLLLGILRHGFSLQHEGWRIGYILWGLACLSVILAAVTVRAYRPGQEQRPGWLATLGILMLGVFYGAGLFRSDWRSSALLMLGLGGLASLFWLRMTKALPRLLDIS